MALATLSIDIEAKLAGLQQGMDQASRLVAKNAAQMERAFDGLRGAGAAVGAVLGGAFAGLGASGLTRYLVEVNAGVDALNDFKDATGTTIENASALEDAAARTGTAFETVQAAVLKLNQTLGDAKPGSEQAEALRRIGLSAEELRKLDPADALLDVAKALARYSDDGDKARLTQDLFGRSIREVAPLLNDLAEKGRLVATVTAEQAEEASKFAKQLSDLEKSSIDAARALSGPMIAAINETISRFRAGSEAGKGFFQTLREEQLKLLGFGTGGSDELTQLGQRIAKLQKQLDDPNVQFNRAGKERELNGLLAQRVELLAKINTSTAGAGRGNINPPLVRPSVGEADPKPGKPTGTGATSERISELDRYIERLQAAQVATFDLSAVQQAELDIAAGKLGTLTELQKERILNEARILDVLKAAPADPVIFGPEIDPERIRERADAERELQSVLDRSDVGQREQLLRTERLLNEAWAEGRLSAEQYGAALRVLDQGFADLLPQLEEAAETTNETVKELGLTFVSAFEDAVVEGKDLRSLLEGLEKDLLRISTRKLITEPFADSVGEFAKGFSGGLSGGSGSADSGAAFAAFLQQIFSGSYDVGTPFVQKTGLALVHKGERIVTAAENRSGRFDSAPSIVIQQSFAPGTDTRTVQQAAAATGQQVRRAMARNT